MQKDLTRNDFDEIDVQNDVSHGDCTQDVHSDTLALPLLFLMNH